MRQVHRISVTSKFEDRSMRLTAINCIFLTCTVMALASEPRPRRHLDQLKGMITNKLFGRNEPNCTQSQPSQAQIKFFKIPGFNDVVIKAVPKGSTSEPVPVYEKIPPNSHVGIIGSYLGTDNLNDTYNALLGVKNLLNSGILGANHEVLEELPLLQPSKVQYIATTQSKPAKPCSTPELVSNLTLQPNRVIVNPPKVPDLVPKQYSYKQVNRDGSLTSYTSSLDFNKGVEVTEKGKTSPFFIDRIRKVPVQLPVPVLPEDSKIIISKPITLGRYPMEFIHPGSSYSYKQIHHDGKLTTYSGLPSFDSIKDGPVIVTKTDKGIPPPPVFLVDSIEKVAATASFPKVPFIDIIKTNPIPMDVPVTYNIPVFGNHMTDIAPGEYAYTQVHGNGGQTTFRSTSGPIDSFIKNPGVSVTQYGLAGPSSNPMASTSDHNPLKPTVPDSTAFSYNRVHSGGRTTSYTGSGMQEYESVNLRPGSIALEAQPVSTYQGFIKNPGVSVTQYGLAALSSNPMASTSDHNPLKPTVPDSTAFSYNQVHSGGRITSFTGSGAQEYGSVNLRPGSIALEAQPVSTYQGIPPASNSFSYKQVGDGKVTTYTGSEVVQENHGANAADTVNSVNHPVPPPHITERIEKVAAGAKLKRPPFSTMPLVNPFAIPVPTGFVRIPSVQTSVPQRPVKMPSTSGTSPFVYKQIYSDGSVTSFGGDGSITAQDSSQAMSIPPSNQRVFESPTYTGPFPMNVNPNAVKPSSPVSGSYSYKLVNNGQLYNNAGDGHVNGYHNNVPYEQIASYEPFPVPPAVPIMPAPVKGCVDPDITYPAVGQPSVLYQEPVPLSYTYRQISHSKPDSFLVVNVEDQPYQQYPNAFPTVNLDHDSNGYVFVPPSIDTIAAPQVQTVASPQSAFSYKQFTNQGLYEYSEGFGSAGVKTNQPVITPAPQEYPAANVYVEQTPLRIPPTPESVTSRNSLIEKPIVVPEQASFSFKQTNTDGSTITTKDNGQNSVSVQVAEAPRPESVPAQGTSSFDTVPLNDLSKPASGQVNDIPPPVSAQVTEKPTLESAQGKLKRRRIIKRVKQRGDIPETD